jgi:hypothetical protein
VLEIGLDPASLGARLSAEVTDALSGPLLPLAGLLGDAARGLTDGLLHTADRIANFALHTGAALPTLPLTPLGPSVGVSRHASSRDVALGTLGQKPGHPGAYGDNRQRVFSNDLHQTGAGPPGLFAHIGNGTLCRAFDRGFGLFLQVLRCQPVAQLINVPAQPAAGQLDLPLDLLGCLLAPGA